MEIKYILGAILLVSVLVGILLQVILWSKGWYLFKHHTNPFKRTCKKCGAISDFIELKGRPESYYYWEIVSEGNDENCRCHKYCEYHEY